MSTKSKVYEEVLNEIQKFIRDNRLSPGDRLPSERELSERLNAGRSSIREALRAIELLGLIETRKGEGTFLKAYRMYHLVDLLAGFILHEPRTKQDILIAKKVIEKESAKLAFSRFNDQAQFELEDVLRQQLSQKQKHYSFFLIIFHLAENYLLQKIWELMDEFSLTIENASYNEQFYRDLISIYKDRNFEGIEELFETLYK